MSTEASLNNFANRVSKTKALKNGPIVFRLSGEDGGDYYLDCSKTMGVARLNKGRPSEKPLVELIGDSRRILAVLEAKKNARTLFFAGGFRVRGDLDYVSDLALELGILQEPL